MAKGEDRRRPNAVLAVAQQALYARRHWRLVREIRAIEARLIAHGRDDVAAVLERRAALNGANAPVAQAVTIMNQAKEAEQPNSTQRLLQAIRDLKASDPDREEREQFEREWQARKEAAAGRQSDDPDPET